MTFTNILEIIFVATTLFLVVDYAMEKFKRKWGENR